ncbi:MAG: alkaline phosphatase D family protein [Saprospiraceae bacterium]
MRKIMFNCPVLLGGRLSLVLFLLFIFGSTSLVAQVEDEFTSKSADEVTQAEEAAFRAKPLDTTQALTTIAFGSCNKLRMPQDMWGSINAEKPDLWIWLGDIIYSDTTDMRVMARDYRRLKWTPGYRKLRAQTPIIGIYDDHDYGQNDGDKNFPMKVGAQKNLMDFLDVPKQSPLRKQEGSYQSYTFGEGEQRIKVIVLDTRYFRDELKPDPTKQTRYIKNMDGDMLGETQWKWLQNELDNSTANLNIICSSVQVLSDQHPHEKWGNFPAARRRLLNMIVKSPAKNVLILSGDRHMAEVSKMNIEALPYPLYDFTSSGLTHIRSGTSEENKMRVGDLIVKRNFGVLKIAWQGAVPTVHMQVYGLKHELLQDIIVKYN